MRNRSPERLSMNLNVRGLTASATLAINEQSARLQAEGKTVYRMGLGQSPFPVPEPVVEALRRHAHEKDYLPVMGLPALRDAVAENHLRKQGVACSGRNVLIGPGSKELMFILQLVFYGELIIPAPSWVSYAPQARIVGRNVVWLRTEQEAGWRLTAAEIEAHCAGDASRPRILILNYPGNPTGGSYTVNELKAIARVARRYDLILISDEIYGELHHRGRHVSIARFYPEGTIISSGLSKWCGAGGWRLGTFVFPDGLRALQEAMAVVASETFTSTSAPIQHAAVTAFKGGPDIEEYLDASRHVLKLIGGTLFERMRTARLRLDRPAGGFYLFPDFAAFRDGLAARGIIDSTTLVKRLLDETGVAALPGAAFGRPPGELTVRLAYVNFDGAAALGSQLQNMGDAVAAGPKLLHGPCRGPVEAIDRLCDWLQQ